MVKKLVCTKCGREIKIDEIFKGGWYCRCNVCASLNEGQRNYVYDHLGSTRHRAIQVIISKGFAEYRDVKDEIYREECFQENEEMDKLFS